MSRLAEHLTARLDAMELDLAELRATLEAPPAPLQAPPTDGGTEALARRVEALEGTVGLLVLLVEAARRLDAAEDVARAARVSLLDAAPPPRRRVAEVTPGQVEERGEAGDRPTNAERDVRRLAAARARALAAEEEPPATVSAWRAARRAAAKGDVT